MKADMVWSPGFAVFSIIPSDIALPPKMQQMLIQEVRRRSNAGKHLSAYRRINKTADHQLKLLSRLAAEHYTVDCGHRGCSHCCRQLIRVGSTLEERSMKGIVRRLPFHIQSYVHRRAEEAERLLNEASESLGRKPGEAADGAVAEAFVSQGGICPFVGIGGDCLIYSDRPWGCRLFVAVGSRCQHGERRNLAIAQQAVRVLNGIAQVTGKVNSNVVSVIRRMAGA